MNGAFQRNKHKPSFLEPLQFKPFGLSPPSTHPCVAAAPLTCLPLPPAPPVGQPVGAVNAQESKREPTLAQTLARRPATPRHRRNLLQGSRTPLLVFLERLTAGATSLASCPPLRTPLAPRRRRGPLQAPFHLRGQSTGLGGGCCSPATPGDQQHSVKDEARTHANLLLGLGLGGGRRCPGRLEFHPSSPPLRITYACVCAF